MKKLFIALLAALIAAMAAYWLLRGTTPPPEASQGGASVTAPPDTATSSAASITTVNPASTATVTKLSPAEFKAKADSVMADLPLSEQLHSLSAEEAHRTPKPLIAAGADIGEIVEAVENNPSLAPQGMEFFGQCARKTSLATSARALCLANMRDLAAKLGGATPDESGIDPDIVRLANKLAE